MAELKGRRELFCREYLKDLNAHQSALRAGYAPSEGPTYAAKILADSEVQERIAELSAERNVEFKVEAVEVLRELHRMLTADVALAFNENGTLKSIHDIPLDLRRTIAGFENEELFEGNGKGREYVGTLKKVKFWSKEKAAELLGRHLALFLDKIKHEGLEGIAEAIASARTREPLV